MIDCNHDELSNERTIRRAKIYHVILEFFVASAIVVLSIFGCLSLYGTPFDPMSPFQVILFVYTLLIGVLCAGWIICLITRSIELVCHVDFDEV